MPAYKVTVSGKSYKVDAPDPDTAWVWANQYHEENTPKKETSLTSALAHGASSMLGQMGTGFKSLTGDTNEAAKAGLKREEESTYESPLSLEKLGSAFKEGIGSGLGELGKQGAYALAENAPTMAGFMGSTAAGATLGSIAGPVGSIVGGIAGAALPSLFQRSGSNIERQAREQEQAGKPINVDTGSAWGGAALQTPLDIAAHAIPLGKQVVGKLFGEEVKKLLGAGETAAAEQLAKKTLLANESFKATVGKGLVAGAAQGPINAVQSAIERAQAGLPLLSPDAIREYGESAYVGALLSPVGVMGRMSGKSGAKEQLAAKNAVNDPLNQLPIDRENRRRIAEELKKTNEQKAKEAAAAEKAAKAADLGLPSIDESLLGEEAPATETTTAPAEKTELPTIDTTQPANSAVLDKQTLLNMGFAEDSERYRDLIGADLTTGEGQSKALVAIKNKSQTLSDETVNALQTKLNQFLAPQRKGKKQNAPSTGVDGTGTKPDTTATGTESERVGSGVEVVEQPGVGQPPAEPVVPTVGVSEPNASTDTGVKEQTTSALELPTADSIFGKKVKAKTGQEWTVVGVEPDGRLKITLGEGKEPITASKETSEFMLNQLREQLAEAKPEVTSETKLSESAKPVETQPPAKPEAAKPHTPIEESPSYQEFVEAEQRAQEAHDALVAAHQELQGVDHLPEQAGAKKRAKRKVKEATDKAVQANEKANKAVEKLQEEHGGGKGAFDAVTAGAEAVGAKVATNDPLRGVPTESVKEYVDTINERIQELKDKITDLRGSQKDVVKNKGISPAEVRAEQIRIENEIEITKRTIKEKQKERDGLLAALEQREAASKQTDEQRMAEEKETDKKLSGVESEKDKDDIGRVNQAVGAMNNQRRTEGSHKATTDYLYNVTQPAKGGFPTRVKKGKVQVDNPAYYHAVEALKYAYANYHEEFSRKNQAAINKIFGLPEKNGIVDKTSAEWKAFFKENARNPKFTEQLFAKGWEQVEGGLPIFDKTDVELRTEQLLKEGKIKDALLSAKEEIKGVRREIIDHLIDVFDSYGYPKLDIVDKLVDPEGKVTNPAGKYDSYNDTVTLTHSTLQSFFAIHELVHAASARLIDLAAAGKIKNEGYEKLNRLYQYLKDNGHLKGEYGEKSLKEFVSEMLANSMLQEKMKKVAYQRPTQNVVQRFWTAFKEFFGFKAEPTELEKVFGEYANNAQERSLELYKQLLEEGRLEQTLNPDRGEENAPAYALHTPQMEAEADASGLTGEKEFTTHMDRVWDKAMRKNSIQTAFVNRLTAAIVEFNKMYGGQIRNALGHINPAVLLSRAQDWMRPSREGQKIGTVGIEDGVHIAKKLKLPELNGDTTQPYYDISVRFPGLAGQEVSYAGVLKKIKEYADQHGLEYKQVAKSTGDIIAKYRLYHLREFNQDTERQINALLAQGKTKNDKDVKALEAQIVSLGGISDAEIDAAYQHFQNNHDIQEISNMLDAVRFSMLDMLVESRRLSREQAEAYKNNIGYIPFSRLGEFGDSFRREMTNTGGNKGVAALRAMKDFHGSERQIDNPLHAFSGFFDWATAEGMKNYAAIRAAEDLNTMRMATRFNGAPPEHTKGEIGIYDGSGDKVHFSIHDPSVWLAFTSYDKPTSGIIKGLQKLSQVLRAGVTMTPPFAIKQIFDDMSRAYAYAGVKNPGQMVARALVGMPKLWLNELKGTHDDLVKQLEARGVVGTYGYSEGLNVKNVLQHIGAEKTPTSQKIMAFMEAMAKASDLSIRREIYKQTFDETGDKILAEHRAREIINFSNRGTSHTMATMASIIPFFNAYAQGMGKLYNAAVNTGAGSTSGMTTRAAQKQFYTRMMMLTGMGLTYALLKAKDDDYWKLQDHVRDNNWILGDSKTAKALGFTPAIPVAPELAYFFKVIPERIVQYHMLKGTPEERSAIRMLGELASRGVDVFSGPNMAAPAMIKPFTENAMNYSFFMGRPLESQAQQQLRPFQREGMGTSETSKWIAEQLEGTRNVTGDLLTISPIKLDNVIRGVFGSVAGTALGFTDMIVNPNKVDRPMHQMLLPQMTGAAAVMKDAVGTRYIDELYKLEADVTQAHQTYNHLMDSDPAKAQEFMLKNKGSIAMYDNVHSLMKMVQDFNKDISLLNSPMMYKMPADKRRERISYFKQLENNIARNVFVLRRQIDQGDGRPGYSQ